MPLDDYRRRRDPARTPEPFAGRPGNGPSRFVVQRHDARRLHYDLRLERDGVLASWAVPKGIPLRAGERRLAVRTEDHPLDYLGFEGTIPAGQYGAGTVELWDAGTYELLEEKRDGGLTVRLAGERLGGVWTLVPASLDGDPRNWLLLRKGGGAAAAAAELAPMLASAANALPAGPGWLFEPKWDGFRALARVAGGEATLTSRNGNDLTSRFPGLARSLPRALRSPEAVLDGEVCALDAEGRSRFSLLQQGGGTLVLVLFDALAIDGEPLLGLPLAERRRRLEEIVVPDASGVAISPAFEDGEALLAAAREQGFEGVVAKRAASRYQPGRRSADWRKVKLRNEQELVIAGYTRGRGRRRSLGALVLAVHEAGRLRYVGNVGTGISDAELERLLALLRPLERDDCPLDEEPRLPRVRRDDVVWVEPELVAQVAFAEWTREGRLRAPVYLGLREDKPAAEVRREREPVPAELRRGKRVLRLSNLDKPFWPEEAITKGDLLAYYRDVGPVLLPHLRGRPFTMKRYPDGWQGKHFFQKDAPSHAPSWVKTAPFPATSRGTRERRVVDYVLVDDDLTLLWVVGMGCIDLNTWASRADRPERPDWVVFDLDPSPDVGFAETVEVALLVKEALDLLELESVAKTSGSRGIHVLVPIARRHTFDDARELATVVAGAIARAQPGLATTEWTKRKRRGVLIDANQNGFGKTIASAYSVRPRAGAPVSTPLRWEEVGPGLDPAAFTMDAVLDRVAREGDLFARALAGRQSLGRALRRLR